MAEDDRIELTYRLWSTGADESFEEYIDHLRSLLPRHRGLMERRVRPVDDAPTTADALVVFSFPDVPSIDGFLRDPLRGDAEDLAARAILRSMITDGRHRATNDTDADVVSLREPE
ncbi:MAG: hypothetical protein GWP47_09020 [Actinobacteria bacterium]|nr:hypothetical protein [Actinomycetota bacterium]